MFPLSFSTLSSDFKTRPTTIRREKNGEHTGQLLFPHSAARRRSRSRLVQGLGKRVQPSRGAAAEAAANRALCSQLSSGIGPGFHFSPGGLSLANSSLSDNCPVTRFPVAKIYAPCQGRRLFCDTARVTISRSRVGISRRLINA